MAELLLIAVAIFAFALVSERLSMAPITAPMVFTSFGLLIGRGGLDWFDVGLEGEAVPILIEATLVVVLFSDAVRIDLRALRQESTFPTRLLAVGLPGTFALGTVVAFVLFDDFGWAEAALLAAALAPTDAALGQAVVSDGRLPVRLRQGLNVESGLNDGIVVPLVTVTLAVAAAEAGGLSRWGEFVARQIGFGVLCGLVAGAVGGRLLRHRSIAGEVDGAYQQLATLAIAAGAFASASLLDGNGFIAAFTAGLCFGAVARPQCQHIQDFTEDEGELLSAITFTVFGAVLAGPALDELSWRIAVYAVLSLTVIRMVPVAVALWRSGTLVETRLFAGWFGPRGLASILFALLIAEELDAPAAHEVYLATTWTILLSVYLHGATASPWVGRLAGRLHDLPPDRAEMAPAPELPTRRGMAEGFTGRAPAP